MTSRSIPLSRLRERVRVRASSVARPLIRLHYPIRHVHARAEWTTERHDFIETLQQAWHRNDSLVCVGLDPEPARFPAHLRGRPDAIFEFCRAIVDATADLVCCFKPQIAHFAALRAEDALERLIAHIHAAHPGVPVILDAKRGDIGSTAQHYAERSVRALRRRRGDRESVPRPRCAGAVPRRAPTRAWSCSAAPPIPARAICRISIVGGQPLYQHVARNGRRANGTRTATACWSSARRGPSELAEVRAIVGDMPLLVPGIGAQGGDVEAVVRHGATADGTRPRDQLIARDPLRRRRRRLRKSRPSGDPGAGRNRSTGIAERYVIYVMS